MESAGKWYFMRYKCGLYGGSFNPLHLGHVQCLIEAANQCGRLIVVISEGINRKEIDARIRYRWIYQLTKHFGNVDIFILKDKEYSKDDYLKECWFHDAQQVQSFAGQKVDAVFCGSDYDESSFWAQCYPDAELIIIERNGMSSSELRRNVYEHWDWLPNIVKPYYVKKVLIIGGESTGKSTLTINLANYYNTNYLEEVGRDISERSGTDLMMLADDFTDILLLHKIREMEAAKSSMRVLFEDTDCLITLFYMDFLDCENKTQNTALAKAIAQLNTYDLIIFLEPDVDFVNDGDRSEVIAADREKYSRDIKDIYRRHGFEFVFINGSYQKRFEKAVELIDEMLLTGGYDEGR